MSYSGEAMVFGPDTTYDNIVVKHSITKTSPFYAATAGVTSSALVAGTPTVVAFPTAVQTSGGILYSAGVFTVPTAGFYSVNTNVVFNAFSGTGARALEVRNVTQSISQGITVPVTVSSVACPMAMVAIVKCNANDTISVRVTATTDTPTVNGASSPAIGYCVVQKMDF